MKTILTILFAALATEAGAQDLIAPKGAPGQYTPPHRPHTKWSELKAKHAGQAEWREPIVNDDRLQAEYIMARPGTKEPRSVHPDTRAWWVVMDGQIRFDIEGQQPFIASRGSIVQVPMQTLFSFETIGDKSSVRFEVNIAGAKTLYTSDVQPPKLPGFDWIPVKFARKPGSYGRNNKAHTTFDEVAKQLDEGKLNGTIPIVDDDRGAANFIYGYGDKLPPINPKDRGHFHPESSEFWLIMAGQIRYPIETQGLIMANVGDVVYVPKNTFHAPRWYGPGASCRLAMNGFPNLAHLFEPK